MNVLILIIKHRTFIKFNSKQLNFPLSFAQIDEHIAWFSNIVLFYMDESITKHALDNIMRYPNANQKPILIQSGAVSEVVRPSSISHRYSLCYIFVQFTNRSHSSLSPAGFRTYRKHPFKFYFNNSQRVVKALLSQTTGV